jgi:hypothetical protein
VRQIVPLLHPELSEFGTIVPLFRKISIRRMTIDYRILVGKSARTRRLARRMLRCSGAGIAEARRLEPALT